MTEQNSPKVTVLMPVFNGAKYLRDAMESILRQDFADFEFLIILDPSTDKSESIIQSYRDPRIRLIKNDHRLGLVGSLNLGFDSASGTYIARMDCDDISHRKRLLKQVRYMDQHPDVGVCGTNARYLQKSLVETLLSRLPTILSLPQTHTAIKCRLIFSNAIFHPSVILRKSLLQKNQLYYDSSWKYIEDYEFWVRLIDRLESSNLPEYMLYYRLHSQKVSVIAQQEQRQNVLKLMTQLIQKLGICPTPREMQLHYDIFFMLLINNRQWLKDVEKWLLKLRHANLRVKYFPVQDFDRILTKMWATICSSMRGHRFWSWKMFWGSRLTPHYNLGLCDKIIFLIKWTIRIF